MSAFPEVEKIVYEGPDSKNLLAFHHYNPEEIVEGKPMREHLRFSVAYWHTMRGAGADPFALERPSAPGKPKTIRLRTLSIASG